MATIPSPAGEASTPFGVSTVYGELFIQRDYEYLWSHKSVTILNARIV